MIGDQAAYRSSGRGSGPPEPCVRRALSVRGSRKATEGGVLTREHADISNEKAGEIPARRKPKVSWATLFVPGLVGT